ncbi:ATP-binding cassette domain-containing protein [Paenibacillus albidus]|uniref:ATP-binding cassette domain-containing protein n=1 Tax=Paenibacillus albidus TaxID=2041023 RepID=UPI00166638B8|nr:ATP-binding cassette domain-containing protein [Paenibacillus albidus]
MAWITHHPYTQALLKACSRILRKQSVGLQETKIWGYQIVEPLLVAENLVKTYRHGKGVVHAVRHVSFTIQKGEYLGLVGESGSDKSSLARLLLVLEKPDHGDIRMQGTSLVQAKKSLLRSMRQHIQVVFQDSNASLNIDCLSGVLCWNRWTISRKLNPSFL